MNAAIKAVPLADPPTPPQKPSRSSRWSTWMTSLIAEIFIRTASIHRPGRHSDLALADLALASGQQPDPATSSANTTCDQVPTATEGAFTAGSS